MPSMRPLLLLSLLLPCCAAAVDVGEPAPAFELVAPSEALAEVWIDPAFGGEDAAVIRAAVDAWHAAGLSVGHVTISAAQEPQEVDGGKSWGWFSDSRREVSIVLERPPSVDMWRLALHELGHAAGLGHHCSVGVMRGCGQWADVQDAITPADLALRGQLD